MKKTGQEREREAREAKLEHMRDQISTGRLVIRQMTSTERATSTEELAAFDAQLSPKERTRREAVLRERRRRARFFS